MEQLIYLVKNRLWRRIFNRAQDMKLQEQLKQKIKLQGKSSKTFETYWQYCYEFLLYLKSQSSDWVHPAKAGRNEIEQWLTAMAPSLADGSQL